MPRQLLLTPHGSDAFAREPRGGIERGGNFRERFVSRTATRNDEEDERAARDDKFGFRLSPSPDE